MNRRWVAAATLTAALFFAGAVLEAAWVPAKATLAQVLLKRSWDRLEEDGASTRPWPWADTRAVALLRVPALGVEQVILAGTSGRNLAFGPVLPESLLAQGDWVVSGHRDTHFRFLAELQPGQRIELVRPGRTETYGVVAIDVVDSRRQDLVVEPGTARLSLVTCYPLDAATPGGPLRYVVTALPAAPAEISRSPRASG